MTWISRVYYALRLVVYFLLTILSLLFYFLYSYFLTTISHNQDIQRIFSLISFYCNIELPENEQSARRHARVLLQDHYIINYYQLSIFIQWEKSNYIFNWLQKWHMSSCLYDTNIYIAIKNQYFIFSTSAKYSHQYNG